MAFQEECERQLAAREAQAAQRQNERQLAAAEEPREQAVVGSAPKPQPYGGGSGGGGGGGGGEGGGGGSGRPRAMPGHSRAAHDSPKRRSMPFSPLTAAALAARRAAHAAEMAAIRARLQNERQLAAAEEPREPAVVGSAPKPQPYGGGSGGGGGGGGGEGGGGGSGRPRAMPGHSRAAHDSPK